MVRLGRRQLPGIERGGRAKSLKVQGLAACVLLELLKV